MIDVTVSRRIQRLRAIVAAYMFDPGNDAAWTTGITASRPDRPGRLRTGATVVRTASFLGRSFDYQFEVIDASGDDFVHMKVDRPFPMQIRYELEDDGAATLVRIHTWGEPGGFFKLAAPMMPAKVRKNITADLTLLQKNLESN